MRKLVFSFLIILGASALATLPKPVGLQIADGAQQQVGVTLIYDPAYVSLRYPNGDVPASRGVCADVVVRAFRVAGIDLQRAVHEDMLHAFKRYPAMWGLSRPDTNIDHRRVPNLMKFFERRGKTATGNFLPGDIVAWRLPGGLYHIGVVSAELAPSQHPLMIHNIGNGAQKEDVLHAYTIIGHYRW
ncbi:MAG: uncharacterized protein QOK37_3694 [Thermoanaerobaculia bacterium]|jgi:uncharacterized protein YijF (DUF1287 family)|nr:uncharacterized protein [Thermoanaerobaculia bacterium]